MMLPKSTVWQENIYITEIHNLYNKYLHQISSCFEYLNIYDESIGFLFILSSKSKKRAQHTLRSITLDLSNYYFFM